jgi:hypothetical protein
MTTVEPQLVETEPDAEDRCPSCPHPRSAHDAIAQRFCTATAAGGFSRGCTCTTKPDTTE